MKESQDARREENEGHNQYCNESSNNSDSPFPRPGPRINAQMEELPDYLDRLRSRIFGEEATP